MSLDHAIIAVRDLDSAVEDYRALGFTVRRGGIHANRATHNALIVFRDSTYLELLAPTGQAAVPGLMDFGVLLEHGEGLAGFALRSADLDTDIGRLRAAGFDVSDAIPGERRRDDGILIRWKLALLDGGFAPFLIQDLTPLTWRVPDNLAVTTHRIRALGLSGLEIAACDIAAAAEHYRILFGAAPSSLPGERQQIGPITLREAAGTNCPEELSALQITFAALGERDFPLEQTHGVRIESSPAGWPSS